MRVVPTVMVRRGSVGRRRDPEEGQILLLTIGVVVLALGLVLALASAAQVHLERKRLFDVADEVALAVSDDMDRAAYYARTASGAPAQVVLTDGAVRDGVQSYLAAHPETLDGLQGVRVVRADATDGGRTVHVALEARARPVLLSWATLGRTGGVAVDADAAARAD